MLCKHLDYIKSISSLKQKQEEEESIIDKSIESIISFHGNIIINNALKIQYHNKGCIDEETIRLILPYVFHFMSKNKSLVLIKYAFVLVIKILEYSNNGLNDHVI